MLIIVCSTAVMIRLPPGVPTTITDLPSFVTMLGLIDDSGRLPGSILLASPCTSPYRLGTPIFAVKSSISSFSKTPVFAAVTLAGQVWIIDGYTLTFAALLLVGGGIMHVASSWTFKLPAGLMLLKVAFVAAAALALRSGWVRPTSSPTAPGRLTLSIIASATS